MSYNTKIWDFPELAVQSQLFYAGGAAADAGFTSGGARVMSPEPGGRSYLDVQLSLQVNEWETPFASWLMSKVNNGEVFRVPLVRTPQLLSDAAIGITSPRGNPWAATGAYPAHKWSNGQFWANWGIVYPVAQHQAGTKQIYVEGQKFKHGHVFGIGDTSYIVDDIEYSEDGFVSVITINPPLRSDVADYDFVLTRPYFLGTVSNPSEFRANYERSDNGHIKPGRLLFAEFIP